MKKLSVLLMLAFISMILIFAESSPVSAQQTVEDQYWELVKDSNNPQDFESYLKEYPDGKYAAIARLKANKGGSSPSFLAYRSSTPNQNNMDFMRSWENQIQTQLPLKFGEYEIHKVEAPTSVENYFYTYVRSPNLNSQSDARTQGNLLKAKLASDYCKSEAFQRKITIVLGLDNTNYSAHLNQRDCKANIPSTPQTDAEFLNNWAEEVRVGLPQMVGNFQLSNSWSRCPVGCQEKESSAYLLLKFRASTAQQNAPIDQLKQSLKPVLLEEYCQTDAIKRKIKLGVFFDNRGSGADFNNFWVYPEDCSAKPSGTTQGKIVFITSQEYDGNLGGVSGANQKCQMHAKNAGLSGTFKAWIADDNSSPWTSFARSTVPYVMTNGMQIAPNWQALITSNLENKLDVNEFGKKHVNAGAWTGTDEGKKLENCRGWTTNDSGEGGTEGCSSTTDSRWGRTNCGENWCSSKYRLYCFQQ